MAHVLVLGGGLAGLASAAALGQSGHHVTVLESRSFLGGRATSYPLPADETGIVIDNCQHILLKCCVNLLDFYRRLGVFDRIEFHKDFYFIEPGGRTSVMRAGVFPKPLHFTESFAGLKFLSLVDKLTIARGLLAIQMERNSRRDLDSITMLDWLREKRQTPRAIERFWRQVLVSAINEELDRMAASHGFQVFYLGFLAAADSYQMGVSDVPLAELYSPEIWQNVPNVDIRYRTPVSAIRFETDRVAEVEAGGESLQADHYISALPFEKLAPLAPELGIDYSPYKHSPIISVHLWFDRPVTDLPHATLLDRNIHWFFSKEDGRYIQLVISAAHSLARTPRAEVVELALRELREFLPASREASVVQSHVVKEIRATFSAATGLEPLRPEATTRFPNFSLAGDWTRTGWPATMEGAVRSGYKAAEAVAAALGEPTHYLLPDIA